MYVDRTIQRRQVRAPGLRAPGREILYREEYGTKQDTFVVHSESKCFVFLGRHCGNGPSRDVGRNLSHDSNSQVCRHDDLRRKTKRTTTLTTRLPINITILLCKILGEASSGEIDFHPLPERARGEN